MSKKRIVLICGVVVELLITSIVCYTVYFFIQAHQQKELIKKATVIKKEDLLFPENPEFKFYYTHIPNNSEKDKPDWLPKPVTYSYNADGLNDRFDYPVAKDPGVFRIVTLGDSFTFGQFVNTKDNWTEVLEDKLNADKLCQYKKVEVINLGMGGYDIPYIIHRYQTIGAKYNPDLIIWFESGSGFQRFDEKLSPMINACQDDKRAHLSAVPDTAANYYDCWTKAEKKLSEEYTQQQLADILSQYLFSFLQTQDPQKIMFFTFDDTLSKDFDRSVYTSWAKKFPKITFLSTVPNIYDLHETLADGHPSIQGHQTMARTVYDYLEQHQLSTCGKPAR